MSSFLHDSDYLIPERMLVDRLFNTVFFSSVTSLSLLQGYGVFTTRKFSRGDFLLHYSGDLITADEARRREKRYDKEKSGSFMYYFLHDGIKYW